MKTIYYLSAIALSVVLLSACEKPQVAPGATASLDNTSADGLCVSFAYELKSQNQSDGSKTYTCNPPKKDCSKIAPCSPILYLDTAISNHALTTYFATQANWQCTFPNLLTDSTLLAQLQAGTKVVIKRNYSSGTTPAYYFVVDSGTTATYPAAANVSYTIRVQ